jgi:hypothetical protein
LGVWTSQQIQPTLPDNDCFLLGRSYCIAGFARNFSEVQGGQVAVAERRPQLLFEPLEFLRQRQFGASGQARSISAWTCANVAGSPPLTAAAVAKSAVGSDFNGLRYPHNQGAKSKDQWWSAVLRRLR